MLHAFLTFAAAEAGGHEETSKTFFYVAGSALAVYAVIVAAIGIKQHDFPQTPGIARAVYAISAVLVALAMASAVVTS